jgi:sporulation protein YlmC with PRC-barrel domain
MQRRGPIGKLHNLVINIKASSIRRALFESKQTEVTDESGETSHTRILRLVTNRGIRWNSTYLMIERAIHLRDALTLY